MTSPASGSRWSIPGRPEADAARKPFGQRGRQATPRAGRHLGRLASLHWGGGFRSQREPLPSAAASSLGLNRAHRVSDRQPHPRQPSRVFCRACSSSRRSASRERLRPWSRPNRSGSYFFPRSRKLDAIDPWEVLSFWTRNFPEDGYAVSCLSRLGGLVQCAKGLVEQAHYSYADAPPLKVMLYPGGRGTRPHLRDDAQLDWVRRQRVDVPLMTSVCTGSLVYAAAGLLSHRPPTTHWGSLDRLAELDPTIDVRPGRALRRRRGCSDVRRHLGGDRHGLAPRGPACRHRPREIRPTRHSVRPGPAGMIVFVDSPSRTADRKTVVYRLACTSALAATTRATLSAAGEPTGSASTSSRPMRVASPRPTA